MPGNMSCVNKELIDNLPPSTPMRKVTEEDALTGQGQFDKYMRASASQLAIQYDEGRIKGADLAAAMVELIPSMMENANKFVIGEVTAKLEAEKSRYELKIAEFQLLKVQAEVSKMCTEENEMRLTGRVQRGKLRAEAGLIETQEKELKANGKSKRALEAVQIESAKEQVLLYRAQTKSFVNKSKNDTFKTVSNMWTVFISEVYDGVGNTPSVLAADGPQGMNQLVNSVRTSVGV